MSAFNKPTPKYPHKHINDYGRRSVQAVQSVSPDLTKMQFVIDGRRKFLVINAKRDVNLYCEGNRKITIHLTRLENFDKEADKLIQQAHDYHNAIKEIFGDADAVDKNKDRRDAFNRIEMSKFKALGLLEDDERIAVFNRLIDEELAKKCNNCNHTVNDLLNSDFISPFDYNPENKRKLPQLIFEAMDRLTYAVLQPSKYKALFFHQTDTETDRWGEKVRQMREEGRVGMLRTLYVFLKHTDLKSLRIWVFNTKKNEWWGLSIAKIAEKANLSISRVETALRNLEKLGIIHKTEKQKCEQKGNGSWRGFPKVRKFTELLFNTLGLERKLLKHRDPEKYETMLSAYEKEQQLKIERREADEKVEKEISSARFGEKPRRDSTYDGNESVFFADLQKMCD